MLIKEILIDRGFVELDGNSMRIPARTRAFLLFRVVKSRSYSWRVMIHR
jgi:hypothetical protein